MIDGVRHAKIEAAFWGLAASVAVYDATGSNLAAGAAWVAVVGVAAFLDLTGRQWGAIDGE